MAWRLHDEIYIYITYNCGIQNNNFVKFEERKNLEETIEQFLIDHELSDEFCVASKNFNHFAEEWFEEFRDICNEYEVYRLDDTWVVKIKALEKLTKMKNSDETGLIKFLTDLHDKIKSFKRKKYYDNYVLIFKFED